jgi:predicted enzyme related to lactoylglutathione lyase
MATLGWFPLPSISMNGLLGADLPAYAGNMITALHTLVYADDAEAARAFFRDVIGWPHIDAHGGWLIFKTGPSELGVHPASDDRGGETWSTGQHHEISLMCDDIEKTVAELSAKGAEFAGGITARGFGLTTMLRVPGAGEMMLYQPTHPPAHSL